MRLFSAQKITLAFAALSAVIVTGFYFFSPLGDVPPATVFLVFFALVIVCFAVSAVLFRPLRDIAGMAHAMAGGDFSKRLSLSSDDEIGELAESLNTMGRRIDARLDELMVSKSRLEAVLLSMFEGVMVVSADGKILLMNQTLKDVLRVERDVAGRVPLEVIRNREIQEIVDRTLQLQGGVESRELSVLLPEEKTLRVHARTVIREGVCDGAVLVFHDITDLRRLERIRTDFVANVSHELRTPVANIKGYAETLLEGAVDDREHAVEFLKIIYSESDRLARLVDDLLELARLESGKSPLAFRDCDLGEIVDWVLAGLNIQVRDKKISVIKNFPRDLSRVKGDESAVAQIFLNLLENAIKYNTPGGRVTVSAREDDFFVDVEVADTGIGIVEEDLPRIFERFYRVDKAHSRQTGGTGLGLSIVKHIVQAHQGHITVTSEPGHGSSFRVALPKVIIP
mgnify:CR=1 FL=1